MGDVPERRSSERSIVTPRLGFDLRPYYDETVAAPIPDRMQTLGTRLIDASPEADAPDPDRETEITPPAPPSR